MEKFSWNLMDSIGDPITGAAPTMRIREIVTGFTYDWDDHQFKDSGWTTTTSTMSEVGPLYPGLYEIEADLDHLTGRYQLFTEWGSYSSLTEVSLVQGSASQFGGLTDQQATMLLEMYDLLGLDPTKPLIVTKSSRQAGSISQQINSDSNQTVVTRIP